MPVAGRETWKKKACKMKNGVKKKSSKSGLKHMRSKGGRKPRHSKPSCDTHLVTPAHPSTVPEQPLPQPKSTRAEVAYLTVDSGWRRNTPSCTSTFTSQNYGGQPVAAAASADAGAQARPPARTPASGTCGSGARYEGGWQREKWSGARGVNGSKVAAEEDSRAPTAKRGEGVAHTLGAVGREGGSCAPSPWNLEIVQVQLRADDHNALKRDHLFGPATASSWHDVFVEASNTAAALPEACVAASHPEASCGAASHPEASCAAAALPEASCAIASLPEASCAAASSEEHRRAVTGSNSGADEVTHMGLLEGQAPAWWQALSRHHSTLEREARETRESFICPITSTLMRSPAFLVETGNTFEYDAVARWVVIQGNRRDPLTNESFRNPQIVPNAQLRREIQRWCEARAVQLDAAAGEIERAHIFVDNTNVHVAPEAIQSLIRCVEAGRTVEERVVVGSGNGGQKAVWQKWKAAGYKVSSDPRQGKEYFVDDALLAQLTRTASLVFNPRRTLVLLTGDGNTNNGRATFPESVEIALRNGWRVEVHSWQRSTSHVYRTFAEQYYTHFKLKFLDNIGLRR